MKLKPGVTLRPGVKVKPSKNFSSKKVATAPSKKS
jgi:hypothetical protein